jgi:hypothetical protein
MIYEIQMKIYQVDNRQLIVQKWFYIKFVFEIFLDMKCNIKEKYVPSDIDIPHSAMCSAFFYKSAAKFEDK